MSGRQSTLLLGRAAERAGLAEQLGPDETVCCPDAYDGLLEMSRRCWQLIILAAGGADFVPLCRASRRLQGEARLLAVCSPADEPLLGPLVPDVLDDYFIWPLTDGDVSRMKRAAWAAGEPGRSGPIPPRQLAELVASARSVEDLERQLCRHVSQLIGSDVRWVDASESPAGVRPLLFVAADSPRVLVCDAAGEPADSAAGALADLQELLGALVAAARRTESLHRLAITDHLTQAYNRRYFYHATDKVLAESGRKGRRATLLLYDIDDFKRYNDAYGYAAGDDILRETTAMIKRITRTHDIVARIGGDEFAVLFWEPEKPRTPDSSPPATAFALADRFRKALRAHEFRSLGPDAKGVLTISGGLATFPSDGQSCRQLLRKANDALRAAKAAGKDAINLIGQD